MKNIIKYSRFVLLAALVVVITFSGCKRQKDPLGNSLCPSDAFTVSLDDLTFNGMTNGVVNLSSGGLNVVANFDESVKWTLTIEANDGSASKAYSGEGKDVSVWWYGNSRKAPLFKPGTCKLTFKVQCRDALTKEFTLQGASNFANTHGSFGCLLRDFDKNGLLDVGTLGVVQGQGVDGYFYPQVTDLSKTVDWTYITTDGSPAGGYYANIDGASTTSSKLWYFGGVSIDDLSATPTSPMKVLSTTDPSNIWLNVYIRSGKTFNTEAVLSVGVDANIKWTYRKKVDWDGWKLCSVRLSDMVSYEGTVLTNVTELKIIDLQLGCAVESLTNEIDYDFVIFTVGAPFFEE
jgi:hypothetical protein